MDGKSLNFTQTYNWWQIDFIIIIIIIPDIQLQYDLPRKLFERGINNKKYIL